MSCQCGVHASASTTPTSSIELVAKLQKAAAGKRIEFTIQRNDWRGGVELHLTAVRVLPAEGAVNA